MDIKEVLNLPIGTEVQANSVWYRVASENGVKVLTRGGYSVKLTQSLVTTEYELVRKKLNFLEAMVLASEGKTIENSWGYIYKRDSDGLIISKNKAHIKEEFNTNEILADEILSDWYEVIE